ncbi:hypothetical protein M9H77_08926 [Catharanthus roseus]|uniref:Uncharacterized protein n=1 Tax=Catharanthus roseus TaxID=4058 RepID=A0ACC0BZC6_CATRO|nr:hypothetical protein M9H77_08926 [Catharanthus roseus]
MTATNLGDVGFLIRSFRSSAPTLTPLIALSGPEDYRYCSSFPSRTKFRINKGSLNRQSPEPETGSSDKFRHPLVNTSRNSEHTVMPICVSKNYDKYFSKGNHSYFQNLK